MALTFATRYRPLLVMVGIAVATALINAISVAVGYWLGLALPTRWILLAAGLVLIGFAVWTLRAEEEDDARDDHTGLAERQLGKRLPERVVRLAAAALFAVFGIWLLIDAVA